MYFFGENNCDGGKRCSLNPPLHVVHVILPHRQIGLRSAWVQILAWVVLPYPIYWPNIDKYQVPNIHKTKKLGLPGFQPSNELMILLRLPTQYHPIPGYHTQYIGPISTNTGYPIFTKQKLGVLGFQPSNKLMILLRLLTQYHPIRQYPILTQCPISHPVTVV